MTDRTKRWWLVDVVIPAGLVASVAALPLSVWDRLPDSLARHWDGAGAPNGWSPKGLFIGLVAGFALATAVTLIVVGLRGMKSKAATFTTYFVLATLLGATAHTVWANLDLGPGEVASDVGFLAVASWIVFAAAVGTLGWFLSDSDSGIGPKPGRNEAVTIDLDPTERAVWLGSAMSWPFTIGGAVAVVAAMVMRNAVSAVLIVLAVLFFLFSASRVSVTNAGVIIGVGPWGWPRKRVPLAAIERAELLEVEPMAFGGWGVRFRGLGDNRTAALVVRRGPGIRLVRPNQADIVVTVDNPDAGAGLINALLTPHSDAAAVEGGE
jgi:hypothetical protein